jgi:ribonuclease D
VVRALWHWREREALAAAKPPFFILSPATMVDMAAGVVADEDISPLVPRYFSPRRRQAMFKAIEEGRAVAHPPQPIKHKGHRQTEAERRRFEALEKRRNRRAHELGIDPTIIASRSTLVQLAHHWDEHSAELLPWQLQLLEPHERTLK